MENITKAVLGNMEDNINKFKESEEHMAFVYIRDAMDYNELGTSERMDVIRNIDNRKVRELLYEFEISELSRDLFASQYQTYAESDKGSEQDYVYLVRFTNGESYAEDFREWMDSQVYTSEEECITAIINKGYTTKKYNGFLEMDMYIKENEVPWADYTANVVKLEVVK